MLMLLSVGSVAFGAQPVTVDVQAGGLFRGLVIVSARWGVPIHLETVPYDRTVDLRVVRRPDGRDLDNLAVNSFEFTYEGSALAGVEAALAGWRAAGGSGDYVIRQDGDALVLVPTTRHENGRTVPYEALCDRVIDLTSVNGTLSLGQTWDAARRALEQEVGGPLRTAHGPRDRPDGGEWDPLARRHVDGGAGPTGATLERWRAGRSAHGRPSRSPRPRARPANARARACTRASSVECSCGIHHARRARRLRGPGAQRRSRRSALRRSSASEGPSAASPSSVLRPAPFSPGR